MLVIVEKRLLSRHFDTGGDEVQSLVQRFFQSGFFKGADITHSTDAVADRVVLVRLGGWGCLLTLCLDLDGGKQLVVVNVINRLHAIRYSIHSFDLGLVIGLGMGTGPRRLIYETVRGCILRRLEEVVFLCAIIHHVLVCPHA